MSYLDSLIDYLHSPEFYSYLFDQAPLYILVMLAIALLAIVLELRLPIRAYWGLPGHICRQIAYRTHILKAPPVWGVCRNQQTNKPLPQVAIELLDSVSHKRRFLTYSNHAGQFGFPLVPGRYLLRASKSSYQQPSFLNLECTEVHSLEHGFVAEVAVVSHQIAPVVDLQLVSQQTPSSSNLTSKIVRYLSMILFQIGHLLVIISAILSLIALWLEPNLFFATSLIICLVLLLIKLYILRMIGWLANPQSAD